MKRVPLLIGVACLSGAATCDPPPPTFVQLRTTVFEPRCGNAAACHGDNPARGLDLLIDPYSALVNQVSVADPTQQYVVPGDPDNSLLLAILRGPVDVDDNALDARQMPPGFVLPQETVAEIEAWIAAGAAND